MENNIKKHETSTTFEYEGRKFKINAFDPMTGNYILLQLFTCIVPFGIMDGLAEQVPGSEKVVKTANKNAKMMTKDEFIQLQTDILSTVYEVYSSGNESPVVRLNGTYGVDDVTMSMCLKLIIASLAFNYKDFFSEAQSAEMFTANRSSLFASSSM